MPTSYMIGYNLSVLSNLSGFVSRPLQHNDWTDAENYILPGSGIYLINNTNTSNFYVGIAQDFNDRFDTRHESAVHLGLGSDQMQLIQTFFGDVQAWNFNTDDDSRNALPVTLARNNYSAALGGTPVNLERLLIQAFLDMGFDGFTYNTNTKLARSKYVNNTGQPIVLFVRSVRPPDNFTTNQQYSGPNAIPLSLNRHWNFWAASLANGADTFQQENFNQDQMNMLSGWLDQ
ncbi:hypothetical protein JM93_00983 [Roseibium hamelinense]|uniref:GIY-YIG domain-containing protein n=1 Tax=Roseibium hamelinense TaxID=150831 RepID=A0A562TJU8_9HYPH|nr:hypothetical protein [Roseibium hamelinense]MTI42778.1 hypothetical protein [Roseibium hamelinense]TWI93426.1 hypothetical protein JM93_00983 [Roseibium hamelinense]